MKKTESCKTKKHLVYVVLAIILVASLTIFIKHIHTDDTSNDTFPKETEKFVYPTVIIDAGHGGEDGGAVGADGTLEKELNLAVASKLAQMLDSADVQTRLTRTDDRLLYDPNADYQGRKKALDMQARLSVANEYTDAVFISIHMNSFPSSKYSGLQVYYSENSPMSQKLAQMVQSTVKQKLQANNNRAIKPSDGNIFLLEKICYPCILIECGFLSNPEECSQLSSEEYQNRLSLAIYDSIMEYFNTYSDNTDDIS